MNMFWNVRWSVAGQGSSAAFVHALRAAAIAAVASSCSTQSDDGYPQEPSAAPPVRTLTPNMSETIKEQLRAEFPQEFGNIEDIKFVSIAYTIEGGGVDEHKLLALDPEPSPVREQVDVDDFRIPRLVEEGSTDPVDGYIGFEDAIVIYTGSSSSQTTCGPPSGGTRYCNF